MEDSDNMQNQLRDARGHKHEKTHTRKKQNGGQSLIGTHSDEFNDGGDQELCWSGAQLSNDGSDQHQMATGSNGDGNETVLNRAKVADEGAELRDTTIYRQR